MHLVEILLPLRDNAGSPFPRTQLATVAAELTERFGGVTAFTRAPAEGLWHDGAEAVVDDVVVVEVMVENLERDWWRAYRDELSRRFRQQELVVRAAAIERL